MTSSVPFLQNEIGLRLLDNLHYMSINPRLVVDLGAGTGLFSPALQRHYKHCHIISADVDLAVLRKVSQPIFRKKTSRLCAAVNAMPVQDRCVELVFSNLMLQTCDPLGHCLAEIRRMLGAGGVFLFSSLGPDTLIELRQSYREVDGKDYVKSFHDMHDVGDALIESGFVEPVMEMEKLSVNYSSMARLMEDITAPGESNALQLLNQGLPDKQQLHDMEKVYREMYSNEDNLKATFEVIYGHAWVGKHARGHKIEPDIRIHPAN